MMTLWKLTVAGAKMFVRNRQALFFTFFFPLFLMTVLGLINFDKPQMIDVGIVLSGPANQQTQQFIDGLHQIPSFAISGGTEAEERDALNNDKRAVVFIIPSNLLPGPGTVTALTNAGQAPQAGEAVGIVSGILDKTALNITGGANLFSLQTQEINTHHLKYIDFLLPGLIALSVMQMSVFSVAFLFTNYKEKGVLKRLIATPMKPSVFVASNVIVRLVVSVLQTAVFVLLGVLAFHAHVVGSYWLMLLLAVLGATMFLGLGFTISGIASTVESVPPLANLVVFPMLFLGGTFFDISSFPNWLQHIAKYLPLTFFSDAMRNVMTKGSTIGQVSHDIWWMLGWSIVLIILANISFGFEEKRQ